jgi:23S rRNA (guanosine2251-2'-O)-methyltransferase
MFYITSFHAIEEKIKADPACGPLLVAKAGPRARELVQLAQKAKISTERTGTAELDRLAPENRGVALAVAGLSDETGSNISLGDYLTGLGKAKNALVLVLDEVTDPHNYGAILRSCDQFGVDLVLSRNARTARNAETVSGTSAGASAWVRSSVVPNLQRAIEQLKEAEFWVYGADMSGGPIFEKDIRGRTAFVLGGEAGLSRLLRECCDALVSIPTCGKVDSLNVSVAAGVILYEARRQRLCGK